MPARIFSSGSSIDVQFRLTSITNPSQYVTDAKAGLSIVMIADANGNPLVNQVLSVAPQAFHYASGNNRYHRGVDFTGYSRGMYVLTVYGNAFAAQQVQFSIK
jgi:hypothetical protein